MPTYTVTASFHVEVDKDYDEMIGYVIDSMPDNAGVYFLKLTSIEQD
jgi:hypothetical protein